MHLNILTAINRGNTK